jgi:protein-ribulosamine 3-kinase
MLPGHLQQEIQEFLFSREGNSAAIQSQSPLSGGDINHAWMISTASSSYFVKYNSAGKYPGMFSAEARGLQRLNDAGALKVPAVIAHSERGPLSWLMLEYIEGSSYGSRFWEDFGTSLALLHKNTADTFGLDHDNYIGSLRQINGHYKSWPDFFIEERLKPQFRLARKNGLADSNLEKSFERLFKALPAIFPGEPPSLLHGDLWSGNFMCDTASRPCLIDPAVYYGFREMDIAMSKLFGGFASGFYEAYNATWPLVPGWEQRLEICNLYPLMVHLNLFGAGYLGSVKRILGGF